MIKIRKVKTLSLDTVAHLLLQTDPWKKMGLKRKDCAGIVKVMRKQQRDLLLLAAFDGREIVGYAQIRWGFLGGGYLATLVVDGKYQSAGVGRALMKESERRVLAKTKNFYLCVSSFNKRAQKFYKRLGFKQVGLFKELMIRGHHELMFRKTTGPIR